MSSYFNAFFFNRLRQAFLPSIIMADTNPQMSDSLQLMSLTFTIDIKWNDYIELISMSATIKFGLLQLSRHFLSSESTSHIYNTTIHSGNYTSMFDHFIKKDLVCNRANTIQHSFSNEST